MRERILDAAIRTLRESGLQSFTQIQVANSAGVRQSHLTYYFPTRDDLLEAVTARVVEGLAAGVRSAAAGEEEGGHGAMLERLATSVADLEHMRMFVAMIVEADGEPLLRDVMVGGTRRMEEALAETLGSDDAEERARLILAAVWGLGLYQFVVRPSRRADPTRPYLSWLTEATRGRGESGGG